MFDSDDFVWGFLLPWQVFVPLLLICLALYGCYRALPFEEREQMCLSQAKSLGIEARYEKPDDCLVHTGTDEWQEISKYKKSGKRIIKD